jgi:hypothetical protein
LKRIPQTAQALQGVNITVDFDYLKSDENRTHMFACEQQVFKQDQKCLFNTEYFQQRQKWLVCHPLVK